MGAALLFEANLYTHLRWRGAARLKIAGATACVKIFDFANNYVFLIQLNILIRISDQREVALELLARDYDRSAVVVGVETE